MKRASVIYWHPLFYRCAMRLLYGRHYAARVAEVARRVPSGRSVLDVCCGDCGLFYELSRRGLGGSYCGVDINGRFVAHASRRGIRAILLDVRSGSLPPADVVVMMASLYQFVPHERQMIARLVQAATDMVIVTEPVRNLAGSGNAIIRRLAAYAADPGTGPIPFRFTEGSLRECLEAGGGAAIREWVRIAGGREILAVLGRSSKDAGKSSHRS